MKTILLVTALCATVTLSHSQTAAQSQPQDQTYNFRYSTGNEGPAQIWREERREADGTIVGKYGYIDPNGEERVVEYRAEEDNFSATGAIGPDNAALRFNQAQQSSASADAARAMDDWNKAAARTSAPAARVRASAPAASSAGPKNNWRQQQTAQLQLAQQQQALAQQQQALAQQQQLQLQRQQQAQQQQQQAAIQSAAIPANWPPKIPDWNNLPRQAPGPSSPVAQQLPQAPANPWANTANTAQWNSAWSNFNWNENNQRVMADWTEPQAQATPQWNVAPAAAPAAPAPAPAPVSAPAIPAAPAAPIVTGPNGAWNMFTEINHADGGLRRAQISPVTALRSNQVQSSPVSQAAPGQPAPPAWAAWPQNNNGFSRRSGSAIRSPRNRIQPAPTVVSQDPFSFSFGVEHNN